MAIGDIIGEIRSLDFDTTGGTSPKTFHIAGTIYGVAYQGFGNDGYVKTIPIQNDGTFGVVKSLEFDLVQGRAPWPIHISGDVYAIAYSGPGNNGIIKTLHIADNGDIDPVIIATFTFEAGGGVVEPVIVHVGGTTYAVFYGGPGNDGWLKTITINNDGTIDAVLQSLEFDTAYGLYSDPIHIAGNVWAFAYTANAMFGPGRIRTVTISDAGIIGSIASGDYDANQTSRPDIFHISGNVYGIVYGGPGNDGWLKTVTISAAGVIGAVINFLEFDIVYGTSPRAVPVGENVWAIAYTGPDNDGWLRTIGIANDGTITGQVDFHEYDTDRGSYSDIIHIYRNVYAVAYLGPGLDGWLKTIEITTPAVAPTVTSNPATGVGLILANINGGLDDDGGEPCECGFEWGPTIAYGLTTQTDSKIKGETFSQLIRGLFPGRAYYFRAFATNSVTTAYGAGLSFHSKPSVSRAYALAREEL